jgi:pyruvate-formate lyase-activating enzyme
MKKTLKPMLVPYEGKHIPHIVIEVNQKCNISCQACYKNKSDYTKPLNMIKDEIDFAAARRKLHVITLAGGEPVLHPDLPEIISYISTKGLTVHLLSNGFALNDELLRSYKKAGLNKIFLHVDSLQRRPDVNKGSSEKETHPLREKLIDKITRNGIRCGLALTLYQQNLSELPDIVDFILSQQHIQSTLFTCCTDHRKVMEHLNGGSSEDTTIPASTQGPGELEGSEVRNSEVMERMYKHFGMTPCLYVSSNMSLSENRWIIYLSFVITLSNGTYSALHLTPSFKRVVKIGHIMDRLLQGRYSFETTLGSLRSILVCLAYAGLCFDMKTISKTLRFLSVLFQPGSKITQKSLTFQQGPNVAEVGELEYCRECPDATVRNGEILPVCLADYLSPIVQEDSQAP